LTNRYYYGSKFTARTSRAGLHRYRRIAIRPTAQDRQEKFKLLAALSIPMLTAHDSRFDTGRASRGNLLRQLTEYMESVGESPTYESMHSCQVHNLIDFKQRRKTESSQIGLNSKAKCKKRWIKQQQILLPMVLTPKMIWKMICEQYCKHNDYLAGYL